MSQPLTFRISFDAAIRLYSRQTSSFNQSRLIIGIARDISIDAHAIALLLDVSKQSGNQVRRVTRRFAVILNATSRL
jgi:hypothetical protein